MSLFIVFGSKFLFDATRTHCRTSFWYLNFTFSAFFHDRSSKFKAFPQALPLSPRVFYGLILIPFYFVLPCWTYPSFSRVQGIYVVRAGPRGFESHLLCYRIRGCHPRYRKESKDTLSQMRRHLLKPKQVMSSVLLYPYFANIY